MAPTASSGEVHGDTAAIPRAAVYGADQDGAGMMARRSSLAVVI